MPTEKPRISVIVDRPDLAVLDRFARATGTPRASVITGLIHSIAPQLDRAAAIMEAAQAVPAETIKSIVDQVGWASDSMGRIEDALAGYDNVLTATEDRLGEQGIRLRRTRGTPSY